MLHVLPWKWTLALSQATHVQDSLEGDVPPPEDVNTFAQTTKKREMGLMPMHPGCRLLKPQTHRLFMRMHSGCTLLILRVVQLGIEPRVQVHTSRATPSLQPTAQKADPFLAAPKHCVW